MKHAIFILLYDTAYMRDYIKRYPGKDVILTQEYIKKTDDLNNELIQMVQQYPGTARFNLKFYTQPFKFIKDFVRQSKNVAGVLNFCDDHTDQTALLSISALFEMFGVPCSGFTTRSLMTSHNKFYSCSVVKELGINVPETHFCTKHNVRDMHITRFPVIIKPIDEGGSEGIDFCNVVHDQNQLTSIVNDITSKYGDAIVQEFLPGSEVTIGVFRHGNEIIPTEPRMSRFINFDDVPAIIASNVKWHLDKKHEVVISTFDGDKTIKEQLINDTIRIFKTFNCRDFARVDWKQDANGVYRFIDYNENPGYYSTSLFRWCLVNKGLTFPDLIHAIIDNLIARIKN